MIQQVIYLFHEYRGTYSVPFAVTVGSLRCGELQDTTTSTKATGHLAVFQVALNEVGLPCVKQDAIWI